MWRGEPDSHGSTWEFNLRSLVKIAQPHSQGLSSLPPLSTTMEAEKRDPGNEVEDHQTEN